MPQARKAPQQPKVRIGATNNDPELVKTIPITQSSDPRRWEVVMRLGPATRSDDPMPELQPGDKLRVFVELEVTTDAKTKTHPGLIGEPYTYNPLVEARFLLTDSPDSTGTQGKSHILDRWSEECSHERHHQVVLLRGREVTIPKGHPAKGYVNVALSASHKDARPGEKLLVGENEDTKTVDQNVSGIRLLRLRPGDQRALRPIPHDKFATSEIRVAKQATVVLSMPLDDLKKDEQLFVHGRLVADARPLGYDARLSARLFLAENTEDIEPKGCVEQITSWKGNLSKENGFNCLSNEGPSNREKFGVARITEDPPRRIWVNLVATSSAPFLENRTPGDRWPFQKGSFIQLVRYPPELLG